MFDPTKPVRTRDGRTARIICADRNGIRPIVALVTRSDGSESTFEYLPSGRYVDTPWREQVYDLVNIPVKTSKFGPVWSKTIGIPKDGTLEGVRQTGKWGEFSESPFLGVVEVLYEDGVIVGSKYHPEDLSH